MRKAGLNEMHGRPKTCISRQAQLNTVSHLCYLSYMCAIILCLYTFSSASPHLPVQAVSNKSHDSYLSVYFGSLCVLHRPCPSLTVDRIESNHSECFTMWTVARIARIQKTKILSRIIYNTN